MAVSLEKLNINILYECNIHINDRTDSSGVSNNAKWYLDTQYNWILR